MRRLLSRLVLPAAISLCISVSCTSLNTPVAGGGTSETIIGRVVDFSGAPAANVTVTLLPALHNPVRDLPVGDSLTAVTGADGRFSLSAPAPGVWNIQAVNPQTGHAALVAGIAVSSADTITAPQATIRQPGFIHVLLPDAADTANDYMYLPGTTLWAACRSHDAVISGVPAGFIPAVYGAKRNDTAAPRVIRTNLGVASGDTTDIADYRSWKYSKSVFLNTTGSGAGVAETVTRFPVLVRLTPANFTFSQARPDGGDLRFTKSDGTPIPHEIEWWDSANAAAAVWVRVDTVYGNDNAHSFTIYWGNSGAAAVPDGAAVFDTADGYTAVWHLAQKGNTPAGDATANNLIGTPSGMDDSSRVTGVVGLAQRFNGTSSFITIAGGAASKLNFPTNGRYTLSAWVKTDTLRGPPYDLDKTSQTIVSKGERFYNLDLNYLNHWHMSVYVDQVGGDQLETPLAPEPKLWQHIVGIRDGTEMLLFVDGEQVQASKYTLSSTMPRDTTFNFQIGKIADRTARYFQGIIDEVRVSQVAYSPSWIKLCYMNQRPDDRLVTLR